MLHLSISCCLKMLRYYGKPGDKLTLYKQKLKVKRVVAVFFMGDEVTHIVPNSSAVKARQLLPSHLFPASVAPCVEESEDDSVLSVQHVLFKEFR